MTETERILLKCLNLQVMIEDAIWNRAIRRAAAIARKGIDPQMISEEIMKLIKEV